MLKDLNIHKTLGEKKMYTLKDKAAGSLSRFFADSASHHSSPSSPSSPPDLSQVIPLFVFFLMYLFL